MRRLDAPRVFWPRFRGHNVSEGDSQVSFIFWGVRGGSCMGAGRHAASFHSARVLPRLPAWRLCPPLVCQYLARRPFKDSEEKLRSRRQLYWFLRGRTSVSSSRQFPIDFVPWYVLCCTFSVSVSSGCRALASPFSVLVSWMYLPLPIPQSRGVATGPKRLLLV